MQFDDSQDSFQREVLNLKIHLKEIKHFKHFSKPLDDNSLCTWEEQFVDELELHFKSFAEGVLVNVKDWKNAVFQFTTKDLDEINDASLHLEKALKDVAILVGLQSDRQDSLTKIVSTIEKACCAFKKHSGSIIRGKGKYNDKLKLMYLIERMQTHRELSSFLPRLNHLKQVLRDSVAQEASAIQNLISESAEWDKIDLLLEEFKGAVVLDPFTSNEASSRLQPLLELRGRKEEQVDALLDELIRNQDFVGIKEFLVPYANSTDQIKKKRFEQWRNKIALDLCETVKRTKESLKSPVTQENVTRIKQGLGATKQAHKELSVKLGKLPGNFQLQDEIRNLEQTLNSKAKKLGTQFESARRNWHFSDMDKSCVEASLIIANFADHLWPINRTLINKMKKEYGTAKNDVLLEIPHFVKNGFQGRDTTHKMLIGLYNATKSQSFGSSQLSALYQKAQTRLTEESRSFLANLYDLADEENFEANLFYLTTACGAMDQHLKRGLSQHILDDTLCTECSTKLEVWRHAQRSLEADLTFNGTNATATLKKWASILDSLDPKSSSFVTRQYNKWKSGTTYNEKVREISARAGDYFNQGKTALRDQDFARVQGCIDTLCAMGRHLDKHVSLAKKRGQDLTNQALEAFMEICKSCQIVSEHGERIELETKYLTFKDMAIHLTNVMEIDEAKKKFALVNQLVHDALRKDIQDIQDLVDTFQFAQLCPKIDLTRKFGGFLADHCSVLNQSLTSNETLHDERWLKKIIDLCKKDFSFGRNLNFVQQFCVLGVLPSASANAIKKAYKALAKKYHPDKTGINDGAEFRSIKEAHDFLLDNINFEERTNPARPFSSILMDIRNILKRDVKTFFEEQRYDKVDKLLFALEDLHLLNDLTTPSMDHEETVKSVKTIITNFIKQARTEVNTNWSTRKYKALNDNITDLQLMQKHLKGHQEIFSESWNQGIIEEVEQEIKKLGKEARGYLLSCAKAKENQDDFRRCFLRMGHVLVELPLFKDTTKQAMCDVLEACLSSDWGYSFLFEFGLSLQRGDENNTEHENQIAQILVTEFSHFKEVMTMVWNEETMQKPVEDTIADMHGKVRDASSGVMKDIILEKSEMLTRFEAFEATYKGLLGKYIEPEADLGKLAKDTVEAANKLLPLDCNQQWGNNVKNQIPHLLAAVFTVFTVRKSGESYNRLRNSQEDTKNIGDKLLMKPHNIQVLTLLSLFGCGGTNTKGTGLQSLLMQIRTGEGKSMILGAAAVLLSILGFKVRCVCYSEYLSSRDFDLFSDVFDDFGVTQQIKYSKITTLSEDTTAAKGDIRKMTLNLLRGNMQAMPQDQTTGVASRLRSGMRKLALESEKESPSDDYRMSTRSKGLSTESSPPKTKTISKNVTKNKERRRTKKMDSVQKMNLNLHSQEILLVDEVDVFFGSEFYGQTYNQVALLREQEISEILNHIWVANKLNQGRRQRLVGIKALPAYSRLSKKFPDFQYMLDSEIALMTDQVRHVNDEPKYYLDRDTGRIGYKVMDTISYDVTYGYRTMFAYLQEAERGNLKDEQAMLADILAIPVSCGRFSYANISPARILGVSGTLSALGEYEKKVLAEYGVSTYVYVPSVYGDSNFDFDKAGQGIQICNGKSDFYHSITERAMQLKKDKRAVIVFFKSSVCLNEFRESPFYRKLGRQTKLLTEDMSKGNKEFAISKAATSGQITLSTAVFGRGTDFFCKDETVQKQGGVEVLQTFLSEEESEEIQIQGRTSRQGKKGSYRMILLDKDLEEQFGLQCKWHDRIAKENWYEALCQARSNKHQGSCKRVEENLAEATIIDRDTHQYFDALLKSDQETALRCFKNIYTTFKKGAMPSQIDLDLAFLVDTTGSMAPYAKSIEKTLVTMLTGSTSILSRLKVKFPDIEFHMRCGILGFKDIDDGTCQFQETQVRGGGSHFLSNVGEATTYLHSILQTPCGGGDIAEDHLGAIEHCITSWKDKDDWTSPIKFILLLTDAPAHGMATKDTNTASGLDAYAVRHPNGLTTQSTIRLLLKNDIDLIFCSCNPMATLITEQTLSADYLASKDNTEQKEIAVLPMVAQSRTNQEQYLSAIQKTHIIFVLDESGSMSRDWSGVVHAYNQYLLRRLSTQNESDLISIVQFDHSAHTSVQLCNVVSAPKVLGYRGGGTSFYPAAAMAVNVAHLTPTTHKPMIVFMSDGGAGDASAAAQCFSQLNNVETHVIAFGSHANMTQLQHIADSSSNGKLHMTADTTDLTSLFVELAGGGQVADVLEAEIGKRIAEAVSDRLAVEYIG